MELIEIIKEELKNREYLNIAIAGCTCSGKSTLAKSIKEVLENNYKVSIMEQDSYFKDLNGIPKSKSGYLMDSTNAFLIYEFKEDVKELLSKGYVLVPNYDTLTNKRLSKDIYLERGQINIFEGLHTVKVLNNLDNLLTIFLDITFDTCLKRRIDRDKKIYKMEEEVIKRYFLTSILPMYQEYIYPQKKEANIVIEEGSDAKCLLKK